MSKIAKIKAPLLKLHEKIQSILFLGTVQKGICMHTAQGNATPNSVFRIWVVIGVTLRGYLRVHRISTTDAVELLCLILTDFINSFHQQNSYSTSTRALSLSRYSPRNFSHISSTTFGVILLANIQTNTFDRITHLTVTEVA